MPDSLALTHYSTQKFFQGKTETQQQRWWNPEVTALLSLCSASLKPPQDQTLALILPPITQKWFTDGATTACLMPIPTGFPEVILYMLHFWIIVRFESCSWFPLCQVKQYCWYKYRKNTFALTNQTKYVLRPFRNKLWAVSLLSLSPVISQQVRNCYFTIYSFKRNSPS